MSRTLDGANVVHIPNEVCFSRCEKFHIYRVIKSNIRRIRVYVQISTQVTWYRTCDLCLMLKMSVLYSALLLMLGVLAALWLLYGLGCLVVSRLRATGKLRYGDHELALQQRLKALDTFRGMAIVFMIFVNDGAGGYWFLEHATWNGLTAGDLVFPSFLWIMGVCIPLAVKSAFAKVVPSTNRAVLDYTGAIWHTEAGSLVTQSRGLRQTTRVLGHTGLWPLDTLDGVLSFRILTWKPHAAARVMRPRRALSADHVLPLPR
ncbi:Heparan-alpha-glucosaminide N-acetyltransferase [Eumeta japonica]|uniref:Heparan-alpha-glucosaminide N-acetyltransferase n=1 Tax=Eumeta variegata TaxID=151549 RepID=A0A4C1WA22_EUMVA|nr:Heparan-alpha-glucosaminide N-acetyltransferase [Eumeta japonica]